MYFPGLENDFFEAHPEYWLLGRGRARPTQAYAQILPEAYQRLAVDPDPYTPGKTWFRGLPCYAEVSAQDYLLQVIRELLDRGVEAFSFDFNSHVRSGHGNAWRVLQGNEGPDSFGFNPPVVAEHQKRHGVNILTEAFEPTALHKLQGMLFAEFLRRIRSTIGPGRRLLATTTVDGHCGHGPDLVAFQMKLEWRKWISKGIANGLMVLAPSTDAIDQVRNKIKSNLENSRVFLWREPAGKTEPSVYRKEWSKIRAGALDGYGLKELAPFYHPQTRSHWSKLLQ